MKLCVVGLGAVGGLLAAWMGLRLPPGRVALSALARGPTLAAVRAQGLRLTDAQGTHALPMRVSDDSAALGPQDLVIVAVKAPALPAVAQAVAALSHADTTVLCAMNGVPWWFFEGLPAASPARGWVLDSVDPGGRLRQAMPASRVVGAVLHLSAALVAPGHVRHGRGQRLVLGDAVGQCVDSAEAAPPISPSISPRTQAVAALLAEAGVAVETTACVQRELWFKLWGNLTMNPISALTGATLDRILADDLLRDFCSGVMREVQAVGARIGLPIAQTPEERHAVTAQLGAVQTSMLQDSLAGRPLEIDALVGSVHELARRLGEPTPQLDALLGLVRLMARGRGLYP